MVNKGIAPPDMQTDVGRLRAILGDLAFVALSPPETGYGDYRYFSDAELGVFLLTGESLEMAAYFAYMQLAASATVDSKSVADYDLKVDDTKRPGEFRALAQMWKDRADEASADIFELFDTVDRCGCQCVPELAAAPVICRGGCGGFRLF